ncbi:MAG: hypothetical protein ACRCSQ_06360 [Bacteroidales bacterium]
MNMKKDPDLRVFLQKGKFVAHSDEFTAGVMNQLSPRKVTYGWSVAFLIVLWGCFGAWLWFWRADLMNVLTHFNLDLQTFRAGVFTPYLSFLLALGLVVWQTFDFISKNLLPSKMLKQRLLS